MVKYEKIRLDCLLDLTADFWEKTNADLTDLRCGAQDHPHHHICFSRHKYKYTRKNTVREGGRNRCTQWPKLYTDSNFCVQFPDGYIRILQFLCLKVILILLQVLAFRANLQMLRPQGLSWNGVWKLVSYRVAFLKMKINQWNIIPGEMGRISSILRDFLFD